MSHHDFKPMKTHGYPIKPGMSYFHCAKCDSVVLYPIGISPEMLNIMFDRSRLQCIEKKTN